MCWKPIKYEILWINDPVWSRESDQTFVLKWNLQKKTYYEELQRRRTKINSKENPVTKIQNQSKSVQFDRMKWLSEALGFLTTRENKTPENGENREQRKTTENWTKIKISAKLLCFFFSFRVPSFSVWTSFSNQPNLKKKRETSEIGHQNSVNVGKLNLKAVPILVKKWFHKSKKNTSDAIWHRCFHREWKTIIPCSLCVPYLMDIVVWKQKKPKGDVFFGLGAVDESSWAERERRRSRDQSQHDSDSTKRKKRSCTMLHKSPTSRVRSKNKPQPSPVPSLVSPKKKLGKT